MEHPPPVSRSFKNKLTRFEISKNWFQKIYFGLTKSFYTNLEDTHEQRNLWNQFITNSNEDKKTGSSLLSVGRSSSQDWEATWRFHVPTMIDPRCRQQLLRWSWDASGLNQEVAKPHKTQVFRRLRIDSSETSQRRRDRRSHLPNFRSCRPSRQWELPVAGSHWLSGTTDLDGQLTENSEEPKDETLKAL